LTSFEINDNQFSKKGVLLVMIHRSEPTISQDMPVVPSGRRLLVTVRNARAVEEIDATSGQLLTSYKMPVKPHEIALSADGKLAFVSLYGSGLYGANAEPHHQLAVIDLQTHETKSMIELGLYHGPHGMGRDCAGMIWATAENNRCAVLIDTASCNIAYSVYLQEPAHFLAMAPARDYVAFSHKEIPFISVFDTATRKLMGQVTLPRGAQSLCYSADGQKLFVGDFDQPCFHIIDSITLMLEQTVALKASPGWPSATADGRHLIVTTYDELNDVGYVEIFDAEALRPLHLVILDGEPFQATPFGDGCHIYVAVGNGKLVTIELATGKIVGGDLRTSSTGNEQICVIDPPRVA
jgi:DNA-binding beta-propeller fold protein YncE